MCMNLIPERFPTRTADRALAGMMGPVTCIIQLEMSFDYELDEKRLERAIYLLTEKIPMLGCRFVPKKFRPYFERLEIERFKIFDLTLDLYEFGVFKNERMDFFNDSQIKACLYRSLSKDCLLVKVSHLVCDAAGVKKIVGELSKIYNRLKDDPDFRPKPVLEDYRGFWQIVQQIPWYAIPKIIYNYMCEIYGSKIPSQSHVLPMQKLANFSSLEVFNYGNSVEQDFETTLSRVTERINQRKSSWLGLNTFISTYPMLWSLPFSILKIAGSKGWEIKSRSPNSFDWLTNMGMIQKEEVDFGGEPVSAWLIVPGCVLPMLFFGCSSYNGTLTFSWSIGPDETNKDIAHTFFDLVISELKSAID